MDKNCKAFQSPDTTDDTKRLQLSFLGSALNILRDRRNTLDLSEKIEEARQSILVSEVSLEDVKNLATSLQEFLAFIVIVRQGLTSIATSVAFQNWKPPNRVWEQRIEDLEKIVAHLNLMRNKDKILLSLCFDAGLETYSLLGKHMLLAMKEREVHVSKRTKTQRTKEKIEKNQRTLLKINIIRILKRKLIGAFFHDHTKHPDINALRTSLRRNLVLEDFSRSWDIGYVEPMNSSD